MYELLFHIAGKSTGTTFSRQDENDAVSADNVYSIRNFSIYHELTYCYICMTNKMNSTQDDIFGPQINLSHKY